MCVCIQVTKLGTPKPLGHAHLNYSLIYAAK